MIVVTGATGKLGASIVERLLDRVPAEELGVSVREAEKARSLQERGVRVRRGDYEDPVSLRDAFEGAEQVLLVSSNTVGETPLRHHRNAIEAAKAVGARRLVYTSHMGANPDSPFPPMRTHAATEVMLRDSGVAFTALRNGFYADSGLMLMGDFLKTGEIVAPADGPVSWTTHDDLADAAVVALAQAGALDDVTPPLTSTEALDLADLAGIASGIAGRPIRRVTVDDEAFRATLASRGVPEERVEVVTGLYAASRNGEFAAVDPALERLLGRPPTPMRDFLAARLAG